MSRTRRSVANSGRISTPHERRSQAAQTPSRVKRRLAIPQFSIVIAAGLVVAAASAMTSRSCQRLSLIRWIPLSRRSRVREHRPSNRIMRTGKRFVRSGLSLASP